MQETKYAISKYKNMGGITCYMNSILAVLQQTPIFADYIVTGKFKQHLLNNLDNINTQYSSKEEIVINSVSYQLYILFKHSMENDDGILTPITLRKTISKKNSIWGESQHQDSQEFLNFMISKLEEEISSKIKFIPGRLFKENNDITNPLLNIIADNEWKRFIKNEYSLIKMLFTGLSQNILSCQYCGNQSNSFEIFQLLSLSIPIINKYTDLLKEFTLEECLDHYVKEEQLDVNNKIECNFCYRKNKAKKQNKIWRTPKVLIIHLKRFLTNDYGIPTQKLNNIIKYPIKNLDISKYINENSPFKDKGKYNLYAVNCHYSLGIFNTINFGHYVSMVKNRYNNKWYCYDDSNQLDEIKYKSNLVNKNAYMLFYYRTN